MLLRALPSRADVLLCAGLFVAAACLLIDLGFPSASIPAVLVWGLGLMLAIEPGWSLGLARLSRTSPGLLRWPAVMAVVGPALVLEWNAPDGLRRLLMATSLAAAIVGCGALFRRNGRGDALGEFLRWLVLGAVCAFAAAPYAHDGLVGSGDARFYAIQLADTLQQVHSGIPQMFIGRSAFAISGDFHPLRTAPYFQHLGLLLDLASGGLLAPVAVMNLEIILSAFGGGFACYLCLRRLAPHAPRLCLVLAILFLTSPGVLALVYGGDMIASWMTLPFLPLAIYGFVVSARGGLTPARAFLVAVTLAALCWAHAPIALWVGVVGLPFLARALVATPRERRSAALWIGVLVFLSLSSYVFISVMRLDLPLQAQQIAGLRAKGIFHQLELGWPGVLQTVSAEGNDLIRDLHLSAGLWLCLLVPLLRPRGIHWPSALLLAGAGVLLLLLAPIPEVAGRIWSVMPARVLATTDEWPMQRFLPILSALAPFAAILGAQQLRNQRSVRVLTAGLTVLATVSVWEAGRFHSRGYTVTWPAETSRKALLPENAGVSPYSRVYADSDSPLDSPTATDFSLTLSLLDPTTLERSMANEAFAVQQFITRASRLQSFAIKSGYARLPRTIRVQPGHRRLLQFDFHGTTPEGTLVVRGQHISQRYSLPSSGNALAFGAAEGNSRIISLWVSGNVGDLVTVRFIPTPGTLLIGSVADVRDLDVRTEDFPLNAEPVANGLQVAGRFHDGWLVTPRIFLPGYSAQVDGQPTAVKRSPGGRVMVRVPAGQHSTFVTYDSGWLLRCSYILALLGWLAVVAMCTWPALRRRRGALAPPVEATPLFACGNEGALGPAAP